MQNDRKDRLVSVTRHVRESQDVKARELAARLKLQGYFNISLAEVYRLALDIGLAALDKQGMQAVKKKRKEQP